MKWLKRLGMIYLVLVVIYGYWPKQLEQVWVGLIELYGDKGVVFITLWVGWFVVMILAARHSGKREDMKYRKIPTLRQYAKENPSTTNGRGQSCYSCGSRSIRNWGYSSSHDGRRVFICNHCGEELYRN